MEKARNFQIVFAGRKKKAFQNKPTDHVRQGRSQDWYEGAGVQKL